MTLFDKISEDIKAAMKARDKVRLETLRNIKKVFLALKILQKLAKQGHESAQTFISNNRQDLADEELAQARVIEEYLPKPLTDEEIESEVKAVIAETGAQGMKDMGRVMGIASKKMAGRADGRAISAIVKRLLA